MYKVLIALFAFLVVSSFQYKNITIADGADNYVPSEQIEGANEEPEKEKSELARMMEEIDKDYKIVEAMSGYYKYKKKQWKKILVVGENIEKITKQIRAKYARPDDPRYEKQMELMEVEAKKMADVAKNKDRDGALEDQQWQVRRLRQTCAICHKHLKIHIYPNLYKEKKHSG